MRGLTHRNWGHPQPATHDGGPHSCCLCSTEYLPFLQPKSVNEASGAEKGNASLEETKPKVVSIAFTCVILHLMGHPWRALHAAEYDGILVPRCLCVASLIAVVKKMFGASTAKVGQQSGLAGCKPPPLFTRGASSCSSQGRRQGEPRGASPRPSAPTYLPSQPKTKSIRAVRSNGTDEAEDTPSKPQQVCACSGRFFGTIWLPLPMCIVVHTHPASHPHTHTPHTYTHGHTHARALNVLHINLPASIGVCVICMQNDTWTWRTTTTHLAMYAKGTTVETMENSEECTN